MTPIDHGYFIHEPVFERSDTLRVAEKIDAMQMGRTRAGARHLLRVPVVRDLATDPRLLRIASQFLSSAAAPFRATLFDKSPGANWFVVWHQDTALPLRRRVDDVAWGPWSTKLGVLYAHAPASAPAQVVALRVSLDDSSVANGPLRVLPTTHLHGVLDRARIDELARQITAVDCVAPAGGVVAMRPLTVHASSKSTSDRPRRVLHIEYAAALNFGNEIELAVG